MSDFERERNALELRVRWLESEVKELKAGQPAVMAERVATLSQRMGELRVEVMGDMAALSDDVRTLKRIFISVFSGLGIAIVAAVVALMITGGRP